MAGNLEIELNQKAPGYKQCSNDNVCTACAFGQLHPFCNLYKAGYIKEYTCDSFRRFEVLDFEPPHGFLMAQTKKTAIANNKRLDINKAYLVISAGEVYGIVELEQGAQIKTKEFDSEEWLEQHRVTPRERRLWWPKVDTFFVYRVRNWYAYEGVKLYEDGKVVDEPKLTPLQWKVVSKAKELPKQIILENDFVSLTTTHTALCGDESFYNRELRPIINATFNKQISLNQANSNDEIIPLYSLALVRNPRMRVSKKKTEERQEGEKMPYEIREREDEYCVVKINPDETEETVACHTTAEEAEAQLIALRINVEAEEGEVETEEEKQTEPNFLKRLELAARDILEFVTFSKKQKVNTKLFMDDIGIGQKFINGELWHFAYSTNAFEDRDNEIFSTKALENYVLSNEVNADKGYFNFWHINAEDGNFNTDFAVKRWQGVIGRFLVEAGPYLPDEKGQRAREFFKEFPGSHPTIAPEGWGCSPEFRYLPEERASGIYDTIWITRTSTLPKFAAANIWTETRQLERGGTKKMALSDQQKEAAVEIFGEEFVSQVVKEAEEKTAELEESGVAHKGEIESNEPETEQAETEAQQVNIDMEELADTMMKQFTTNFAPIAEAITAMSEKVEELEKWKDAQEKEKNTKLLTETPRYVLNMMRATESEKTVVTEDDKLKGQKPTEQESKGGDSWSKLFNK